MDRTLRNKIKLACLSAIILGAIPLAGAEVVRKSASASYSDAATGLVFPPRLHTFEKVSVRVNPDPRFGSVVAYENEAGTFADVFLYRLTAEAGKKITPEQLQAHIKETVQRLSTINTRSKQIKSVQQIKVENTLPVKASAAFLITVRDETFMSLLYLWEYKGSIIKVRITYSEQMDSEKNAALEFMKLLIAMTKKK